MLATAASMLPPADSAWSHPRAKGLAWSDMTSATRETPTANWPPTPRPVRNRKAEKSHTPLDRALNPVNAE